MSKQALRVGIGGPVGSGKTALTLALCQALRDKYNIAAVTNDIYTQEDAQFLTRAGALEPERIRGVDCGALRKNSRFFGKIVLAKFLGIVTIIVV